MVRVYPNHHCLSLAAAKTVAHVGRKAVKETGEFHVVLSGGSTPVDAYRELAQMTRGDRVLWEHTHVFWADERCVPEDDDRSNYRLARLTLLDRVHVPAAHVHRIEGENLNRQEAARRYQSILAESPDLLLLGMGEDGHTASLFPGSPLLHESNSRVAVAQVPAEPPCRITITPPVIAAAKMVVVMVSGHSKAEALQRVFAKEGSIKETPARLVRDADWLVDRAAATRLADLKVCIHIQQ